MQHGLAVKADGGDLLRLHPVGGEKIVDGLRLRAGQGRLGAGENIRLRPLETPGAGGVDRLRQDGAHGVGIGRERPGTEFRHLLAIGADGGDVDIAVQHRAGHQTDRPNRLHALVSSRGHGFGKSSRPGQAAPRPI